MSSLLAARRNERSTAARLKAELSAYRPLGVLPTLLLSKRSWPSVSDRQLNLIEAWEGLVGDEEACAAEPRPLGVVETFALVETVEGDLHHVVNEIAELAWCGLGSTLDVTGASGPVEQEGVRLGVLLHQGWEPRIALASLSFDAGADYLLEENQWWLRQCPEGLPLTEFDIEHADSDLDHEAVLALVAATRNGSAAPPDIRPGDVLLTAARAQVSVGEVIEACRRMAFDVPALTCDLEYQPDWTDAALAALLLAIPEPPVETDLPLVAELVGVPAGEVRDRLLRFGHEL